jgi:transcriptional regulator with XRE-family HTH domain
MANGGRPVERPVHLTVEQRRRAQAKTAAWRERTRLSQQNFAKAIGVGHSTYRSWENSREENSGPTRPLCEQLNRALVRLLGEDYRDGDAFEVWGWPRQWDLRYEQVTDLLRASGFIVPDVPESPSALPSTVFWVHRLREPNLVHGVFSLAAAATTRAGMSVSLVLDDTLLPPSRRPGMRSQFEAAVRKWFRFAQGVESALSVDAYSSILSPAHQTERGWQAVIDYLNDDCQILDLLRASKIVSPLDYSTDAEESVLDIVRHSDSLTADQLLTPLRNWLVFEKKIAELSQPASGDRPTLVVTLGGEDERILWDLWHRGCADSLSNRVEHIYLHPMPIPSYRSPWREPALAVGVSRNQLGDYLRNRISRSPDMIEWFLQAAVHLPSSLNQDFQASLDPLLRDTQALLRAPSVEVVGVAGTVAKAVVEWLNGPSSSQSSYLSKSSATAARELTCSPEKPAAGEAVRWIARIPARCGPTTSARILSPTNTAFSAREVLAVSAAS